MPCQLGLQGLVSRVTVAPTQRPVRCEKRQTTMARTPLYSRSPRDRSTPVAGPNAPLQPALPLGRWAHARQAGAAWVARHERALWASAALLLALVAGWPAWTQRSARTASFEEIDAAMRESITKEPLPSAAVAAYEAVIPSVVRVIGERDPPKEQAQDFKALAPGAGAKPGRSASGPSAHRADGKTTAKPADKPASGPARTDEPLNPEDRNRSIGTGVVIVDKGLILTNLHVVLGADRIKVVFADGSESPARIVNVQPEHDLAVLQAEIIPDDLHAATMRSTSGLSPGDTVMAVGFPYGIGPSASVGAVSGLKRGFRSPEGQRILTNLIQFDAAANPGNSGGPLVTMDGHVVGIVTAIMNPSGARTFIGIGFAVPIENAASAAGLPPF